MSSDEQDRPRKTLTIKKTARDARAESEAAPAKRSAAAPAPAWSPRSSATRKNRTPEDAGRARARRR